MMTGAFRRDAEAELYIAAVRSFLSEMPCRAVVVDIGCGNFAVESPLVDLAAAYPGIFGALLSIATRRVKCG